MRLTVCPFSVVVFFGSAYLVTLRQRMVKEEKDDDEEAKKESEGRNRQAIITEKKVFLPSCQVIFVVGAPGSGKGTQCKLLAERVGDGTIWAHLSAGDLLRAERTKGGTLGDLINEKIANGLLVPSEVTCQLIENAMSDIFAKHGITKFLIDGYPRSQGNADAWNKTMSKHHVLCLLSLECPEEVLIGRLLERSKTSGRVDDTVDVIRKRFRTFLEEEAPIIQWYESQNLVKRIASDRAVESIYADIVTVLNDL